MSTLGLGTAQFGMPYGVSNRAGQTPHDELVAILEVAAAAGIEVLDTAALYGSSESALGAALRPGHTFGIVTKTPRFECDSHESARQLRETFQQSLAKLRQERVYGLLVHNADDLLGHAGSAIWAEMEELRREGLVEKIGVSVYTGEQIDHVVDRYFPEIVQVPVNVFDQRLVASGHLEHLKTIGVEVHARSVFLQGLLLMDAAMLPAHFERHRKHITRYFEWIDHAGMSGLSAALGFVRALERVDVVLVGVTRASELEEVLSAGRLPASDLDYAQFAIADTDLIDPSRWRIEATACKVTP